MTTPISAPFGTWQSSISGEFLANRSTRLVETQWYGDDLFWIEGRPTEKGRQTVMCKNASGNVQSLIPAPWNVRSRAHEYGGGNYCVTADYVFFINADDQQIYGFHKERQTITQLTNQPNCRFADLSGHINSAYLLAICEDHTLSSTTPTNQLVMIQLDNQWPSTPEIIDPQHDFISNPRLSPCGRWLSYLTWDQPNMPWDESQIWLRERDDQGQFSEKFLVAGEPGESLFQPQWSPNGDLYWVSDRSNWWNLKRLPKADLVSVKQQGHSQKIEVVLLENAEYATPQWVFGMSSYGFLDEHTLFATYTQNGSWFLTTLSHDENGWQKHPLTNEFNSVHHVHAHQGKASFIAASATQADAVYIWQNNKISAVTEIHQDIPVEDISIAEAFQFTTDEKTDRQAYGFYYAPKNSRYTPPANALPPLIVVGHGGPTGSSDPSFSFKVQYWTQRGFAVIDVNYRGSTGFGRQFRDALKNQWGVTDVEDLSHAASHAVKMGWANPDQLIVRGSSAGGFTVLAALTDTDTFKAGVCLYGVGDLELLATDTHKFEARYLDGLIGAYPEEKTTYITRSPIHKVDQIDCPIILFQGLQDKVVPPNQAETIFTAARQKGLPVAYVTYPQEGHGFRSADTICHQVEAELYFYQQIFSLPGDPISPAPCTIENWGN